ncbi:alpha/beta hydrolase [Aurantimonas sp. VKM B-3413]|uniref:alpha/beta hydrolase n=1 Tax=Aurantimonas sp. VKM B-3413 TaxID=2779401 RepID=UPI001E28EAD0|nr:alpha/beta hydrolase [Aurantimonas sp. VKM B-3413]
MTFPLLRPVIALGAALAAFGLSGCASALNAATSRAGYDVVSDIRYAPGTRGTYDLYRPEDAGADAPAVVFIHGGSWDTGSKEIYRFLGQSLASAGVIVAIPNYRLYPQTRFPGFVEDAAKATAAFASALRNGENGIPRGRHKLFLMGHSAGAEIAGLLATDGRWLTQQGLPLRRIAGFIGLAGPYDFLPLTDERYKSIFPEKLRAASQPVNFVDGDEPPMLLIAGAADETVDPKNTRSLAAKVRAAGGSVEETLYPGVSHVGAITAFATTLPLGDRDIRAQTLHFIRDHAR